MTPLLRHPELLAVAAVALALLLAGVIRRDRMRKRLAGSVGGIHALARLTGGGPPAPPAARILLLAVAVGAVGLVGADPVPPPAEEEPPPPAPLRSVVFALNVSASMQAEDVPSGRLGRSVEIVAELLDALEGDRVGLLLFAGTAYRLAPPTLDHAAVRYLLDGVTPTIASAHDPGTLVSVGIREAAALLDAPQAEEGDRLIVLLGDGGSGEPEAAVLDAVREAGSAGIRIHTVGVGTDEGSTFRMPAAPFQLGGVVMGPDGQPAHSSLDRGALARIADAGAGSFTDGNDADAVRALAAALRRVPPPPSPEPPGTGWWDAALARRLLALALLLLAAEGLLDLRILRRHPAPAGRGSR